MSGFVSVAHERVHRQTKAIATKKNGFVILITGAGKLLNIDIAYRKPTKAELVVVIIVCNYKEE